MYNYYSHLFESLPKKSDCDRECLSAPGGRILYFIQIWDSCI